MRTQEELVESCMTLVHHLARQYASQNSAASLEDLVGEGYVGLVQAAQKFQDTRGVKFSTFAMSRIRGAMVDSLRRERPVSRPMAERMANYEAASAQLHDELGREPSDVELGDRLGLPAAKLGEVRRMRALRVTSLEVQVDEKHHEFPDDHNTPEEEAVAAVMKDEIRGYVARLMPRDREVIQRIYWRRQKHSQVAEGLGISESRVSQLQTRALSRLREMMEAAGEIKAA